MRDLLFEIGCEEIPASFMPPALAKLAEIFKEFCSKERITFGEIKTMGTPRRIVLIAKDVSEEAADMETEIKGPPAKAALAPDDSWSAVAEKFAASRGITVEQLKIGATEKGDYAFAVIKDTGKPTLEILPKFPEFAVASLTFPKSMKWGVRTTRFARPLRWFLFLFGSDVIKTEVDGVPCSNVTYGNRYYGHDPIRIDAIEEYSEKLEAAGVMVDNERRKEIIKQSVYSLTKAEGTPHIPDSLLEEVNFLVEYPYCATGSFPEEFTELPPEALIVCIVKNQRYFPILDPETGKVRPRFVVVMNAPLMNSEIVIRAYEKVLISRLKDAKFFFDEDVKIPLPDRVQKLARITFQQQLGSMLDKAHRVRDFASSLAKKLNMPESGIAVIARAAELMKADLTTQMLFEYTEIQGTIGKHYARHAGEPEPVALAIEEHYMPRFADDALPASLPGALLALSDKLDTIAGYFSIGLIPSGSMDPFQLRRQTLGVIRILDDFKFPFPLRELFSSALTNFPESVITEDKRPAVVNSMMDFFKTRFSNYMESQGFEYDVVNSISLDAPSIADIRARAEAVAAAKAAPNFKELHEVFTRVSNILVKSAKDKDFKAGPPDASLISEQPEKELYEKAEAIQTQWDSASEQDSAADQVSTATQSSPSTQSTASTQSSAPDYKSMMENLFTLTAAAHNFFDHVLVMAEDPAVRANRLSILSMIRSLYLRVADFKQIVVKG